MPPQDRIKGCVGENDGIDGCFSAADRNGKHIFGNICEGLEIADRILGVDHACDDKQRTWRLLFKPCHRFSDNFACTGIVTAIDPDFRPLGAISWIFPVRIRCNRPGHSTDVMAFSIIRSVTSKARCLHRADRCCGIGKLMASREAVVKAHHQTELILETSVQILRERKNLARTL